MQFKRITEIVDNPKRDCIYDIISNLNLKLCVDIGAAAGHSTKKLMEISGFQTEVVAFEPYPGNHHFFEESIKANENNVRLVKKAVSDSVGTVEFVVPSVVSGSESGWEDYEGYSSVGFLSSVSDTKEASFKLKFKKLLNYPLIGFVYTLLGRSRPQLIKVESTTIDRELGNANIDFMKIDVQGAEEQVLLGAQNLLQGQKIDILYIEWTGEKAVVELLIANGYEVFDSTYVVGPKVHDKEPFESIGFKCIDEINLSTGHPAFEFVLENNSLSPHDAISKVKSSNLGWIQTDLIAVSRNKKGQFLEATKLYCDSQAQ